jgi:hypothetical protein
MVRLLSALALFTAADIQNAKCQVGCRWAGYDDGEARKEHCACLDFKDFSAVTAEKKAPLNGRIFFGDESSVLEDE